MSQDGYFFEGINIFISTFCVCANGFQGLSTAFRYPIQFSLLYVKTISASTESTYLLL
jgi:hypothetical protein